MKDLDFINVSCPCCGELINLAVDTSIEQQQYVEGCQVCCRSMLVSVSVDGIGDRPVSVVVRAEND